MSLLAPLYMAGLAAISLPILFHLIRRTPRGQVAFSSLMFLSPSPPRVTRRSRLEHIALLILRGLTLALLGLAFARPFLRDATSLALAEQSSRRLAIVVDRSGSMRRSDLWQQAQAQVEQVLNDITPADQVALVVFAGQAEIPVTFATWNDTPPAQRPALVRSAMEKIAPSWEATRLDDALVTAADLLADVADDPETSSNAMREIVLISDLQRGAALKSLQGFAWPNGVTLDVRSVTPKLPTNASVRLAGDTEESIAEATSGDKLRVRVTNEPDSTREQFTLHWATSAGEVASIDPTPVYVSPGQSRVFRVNRPAARVADRLVLKGDGHDFDNTLYLAPVRQEEVTVVCFGDDAADDAQGLYYYLRRAFSDSPRRKVRLIAVTSQQPLDPRDAESMRLAVMAGKPAEDQVEAAKRFVARGGTLLVPLAASDAGLVERLVDVPKLAVEESAARDFALLGELDFTHPLFAPFKDARFGDFTKIHFWKHRRVRLLDDANVKVLARFDDGDPAIFEQTIGDGSVIVLATSWRPVDSQLAVSSKFVPLLSAMLDLHGATDTERTQFTVGDTLALAKADAELSARPGVYEIEGRRLAVNLGADESHTAPLEVEQLEQYGVALETEETRQVEQERRRQLRIAELENRQKLWRWVIVAALGLVIAETTVAGRLTRKANG
jgi:hypothetical protein